MIQSNASNTDSNAAAQLTRALARFVAEARIEQLPPAVVRESKRALVSFFSTCISGSAHPILDRMVATLRPFCGPPTTTLIGRTETLDAPTAAFLNAAAASVLDFDDTHGPTSIHPGAPILAPLLALSQQQRLTGSELLHAYALGVDVACRVGRALSPAHYRQGWHITATCAVLGAAAATGRLLDLDPNHLRSALGIAATRSGGLTANLGFAAKSVGVGSAAREGMMAALFAAAGVDAAPKSIEGERGLLSVMSSQTDVAAAVADLGTRWEVLDTAYKPYPTCALVTPVVDAALEVQQQGNFNLANIQTIHVRGPAALLRLADRPVPRSGIESVLSLQHTVAVVLTRGRAGLTEFSEPALTDPGTVELRKRVQAVAEDSAADGTAHIQVQMSDGTTLESKIAHARGSTQRPLSDAELTAKACDLIRATVPSIDALRLLDLLWNIEAAGDVRPLLRVAAPRTPFIAGTDPE